METTNQRMKMYQEAGYAYLIEYKEWNETYGTYMSKSFPTTRCALRKHLEHIKSRDTVELTVTEIKAN